MKRIILLNAFFLIIKISIGQVDTTFFNSDWEKSQRAEAKYYRIIIPKNDQFLIHDMYMNNNPQMIALCSNSVSPLIKDGYCIYYNENGHKEYQGSYKNDNPIGTWIWYDNNATDSTVATYMDDGTKTYTRFSRIELEKTITSNDVYELADEMPTFQGGLGAMNDFISKEFKLPKVDKRNNVTGTFYALIVVNKDGSITFTEIKKSLSPTLDEEAIRVIKKMPNWTSGKIDNKTVKVKTIIPFKIN